MDQKLETQRIIQNLDIDTYLPRQVELFILDRRAAGLSSRTVDYYIDKLKPFIEFCEGQLIKSVLKVDAQVLREYMLSLAGSGHNKGGQHAHYRAVRAFLYWFELEMEPAGWKNPIKKVRAPKVPQEILKPVKIDEVKELLKACDKSNIFGLRDAAIFYMLFDTGLRASELLSLNRSDVDQIGTVTVRHGKGGKDRIVFIGKKSRLALRRYLNARRDELPPLFLSRYQDRLDYDGLRAIVERRAAEVHLSKITLHSFRRAFALNMLRAGTDIHTLAKLMGHSNVTILAKYLKIDETDTRAAHHRGNPVDDNF